MGHIAINTFMYTRIFREINTEILVLEAKKNFIYFTVKIGGFKYR